MTVDSWLLLALAPVAALLIGLLGWRARAARLTATRIWAPDLAAARQRAGRAGPWLLGAAALLAMAGASGPRWGRSVTEMQGRALNLAVAIDISRSMLAEDVAPNRLRRAVREAQRLVQDAGGDRLALLAFAGRSYILTPLTLDAAAVSQQLDALDPEIASEGGTEIADVLTQGRGLLGAAAEGGARLLVVFTDGETHDSIGPALAAARALGGAGITLVMVGAGDTLPVRIPLRDEETGRLLGHKTDAEGRVVRTWRRDDNLRAITDAAGGILVSGNAADQAGAVRRVLDGLERTAMRERRREDLTPRGWWFALGAVALLGLQGVLRRGPALALLAFALLPRAATAQRPSTGDRLLRRGDTSGAALAFAREAARRYSADTALFNAGTASLARHQYAAAAQWLTAASRSLDPELRFRALYNLGLVALLQAPRDSSKQAELRDEAAARFREALLLQPGSLETKWNLELAQPPRPPPSSGGGGTPPPTPPRNAPPRAGPTGSAISQAEAEQILNSVERTERDVRADQARRRRTAHSAAGKDW